MENKEKEGIEIDLKRLFSALLYRWWIILLAMILCGTATFCYAWFGVTPVYSSSVKLYVNNNYVDSPGYSSAQILAAKDLAATYMVILESRNVLDVVSDRTNGYYSYSQLKSMVSATAINETEVFQVTVTGASYKDVAIIANHIADVLPEKITAIVEGSSVRVVDYAVENPNPVGPNYEKYALLGAAIGLVLSMGVIILADVTDTRIKSEEYLIQVYGKFPLLAVIPGAESSSGYGKKGYYRGYSYGYYESEKKRQERKKQQRQPQRSEAQPSKAEPKKSDEQQRGGSV